MSLPEIKEWPEYSDNPNGADPMLADINSPYNKVRFLGY